MKRRFAFVAWFLMLSAPSSAATLDGLADFEVLEPFAPDPIYGGSILAQLATGVETYVEAVNFTGTGVVGEIVAFPDRFPQPFPDNSGHYLAHGRPSILDYTPVGNKGLFLRVGDLAGYLGTPSDLFDLVSIDVANFARSAANTREYRPATVQLTTAAAPVPYIRGAAQNGWLSVSSPGSLVDEPGKIKFETIHLADSTEPGFPGYQFRGIRSASIGLDNVRGIDNIKTRWSRENFNAPTSVQVFEQELSGPGLVADGLAVYHRPPFIETSGNEAPVVVTSTERRVFRWSNDTLATSGYRLRVAGELEYSWVVEGGGFVKVEPTYTLRRLDGVGMGGGSEGGVTASSIERREGSITALPTQFIQFDGTLVSHGLYEVVSTLTITADPRGGYAAVSFDRGLGWEVRIAGTSLIPEPATWLSVALALALGCGMRLKRTAM
jgi:hypothetical protein